MVYRKTNIVLAIIHALLTVLIGSLVLPNDFNMDFTTRVHGFSKVGPAIVPESRVGRNLNNYIKGGLVFFYVWTALAHTIYAIDPFGYYTKSVQSGINVMRWIEYAVSATVMLGIMAIISGVRDDYAFDLLLYMSVAIMSTGYWYESTNGSKVSLFIGFMLLFGVAVTIISSFNRTLNDVNNIGVTIPDFVYGVVYIMLGFYSVFGVVPLMPKRFQERIYMVLSLLAKGCLGVLLAIGANRGMGR